MPGGNVHNGGDVNALYTTFAEQIALLPDNTLVYPGHDYIETNLRFTLAREPGNAAASARLPSVADHDPAASAVTTLGEEKQFNTFLRLGSPGLIAKLRESFPDLPEQLDAKTVFTVEVLEVGKPFSKVKLLIEDYPFDSVAQLSGTKKVQLQPGMIVEVVVNSRSKEGEIKQVTFWG